MKPIGHNPFKEFLDRYWGDPVRFVEEMLEVRPDDWQAMVLMDIARGERRISIASCHGPGKTATLAWAAIWFILTRYPSKCVMTAPSAPQLFDALFSETKAWINRLPDFLKELLAVTSDRIALKSAPDEVFISARTSRAESPEAMQGIHSANVLLLPDEASGIAEEVFNAASGSMSGENACTVLTGNPTRGNGLFYDTHTRLKEHWKTYRIFAKKSPLAPEEVREGQHQIIGSDRVSEKYIDEIRLRSGEGSAEYDVRILGMFPRTDDNTVISIDLAESAKFRDVTVNPNASRVWGVDVARFGNDRSALVRRQANVVYDVRTFKNLDLMQLCGVIKSEYDIAEPKPDSIVVDSIGVGAGVVDRLRELGLPVLGINVSESPSIGNYRNLRAELWYRVREWLARRDCKIPRDDSLIADLTSARYLFTSNGKIQVEAKEDMKKRGIPSPDLADALCLTFAAPEGVFSTGGAYRWNKPVRRDLRGLV